ncbi:MAG: hypothetical protein AAFX85_17035, partial [Pseudomonadota bacterium]
SPSLSRWSSWPGACSQEGFLRFVIFPELSGDYLFASVSMQTGTPSKDRNATLLHLQESVYVVRDRYLLEHPGATDPLQHVATFTETDTGGSVIVEMPPVGTQSLNGDDLAALWREQAGDVPACVPCATRHRPRSRHVRPMRGCAPGWVRSPPWLASSPSKSRSSA